MKMTAELNVINVSWGSFTDEKTGQPRTYGSVMVLDPEPSKDGFVGAKASKLQIEPSDPNVTNEQLGSTIAAYINNQPLPCTLNFECGTKVVTDSNGTDRNSITISDFKPTKK